MSFYDFKLARSNSLEWTASLKWTRDEVNIYGEKADDTSDDAFILKIIYMTSTGNGSLFYELKGFYDGKKFAPM